MNEQLTAIFQIGQRYVLYELSLFLLFTLDYLSEHSHIYPALILLITQNLPNYLVFCFLFICMIFPTQIFLSPISLELLELFQGIVSNNERLKEEKLES